MAVFLIQFLAEENELPKPIGRQKFNQLSFYFPYLIKPTVSVCLSAVMICLLNIIFEEKMISVLRLNKYVLLYKLQ